MDMTTIGKHTIPPEVQTLFDKLAKTEEFGKLISDGDVDHIDADIILSAHPNRELNQKDLKKINRQLKAVGEEPITEQDLAMMYETCRHIFNLDFERFKMPTSLDSAALDRARTMIQDSDIRDTSFRGKLQMVTDEINADPDLKARLLEIAGYQVAPEGSKQPYTNAEGHAVKEHDTEFDLARAYYVDHALHHSAYTLEYKKAGVAVLRDQNVVPVSKRQGGKFANMGLFENSNPEFPPRNTAEMYHILRPNTPMGSLTMDHFHSLIDQLLAENL